MTVLVGVDVGGSGLRCQSVDDGVAGPVFSAPGVRIGPSGLDLAALISVVAEQVTGPPDVLVWSSRGLSLSHPGTLEALIRERLRPHAFAVCGDALGGLVGAIGSVLPGAVVAAGSGAIAFGTDFDRVWQKVDGWGHVIGDRGSAAWVGLRALETALLTYDGITSDGAALLAAATERIGNPETWPRTVMTRPDAVGVIASLAPDVAALAPTDPAAAAICAQAGRELARSLAAAASGMQGVHLSRTGGLFAAAPILDAFEAEALRLGLDVRPPAGTGLDGALHLARHLAEGRPLTAHPAYLILG